MDMPKDLHVVLYGMTLAEAHLGTWMTRYIFCRVSFLGWRMKVLWWPLLCPMRGQSGAAALTFLFGRFGREHRVSVPATHPHHL